MTDEERYEVYVEDNEKFRNAQSEAYDFIFEGIDLHGGYNRLDAKRVYDRVSEGVKYYSMLDVIPNSWVYEMPTSPLVVIEKILDMMGLPIRMFKTSPLTTYAIDPKYLDKIKMYAERRAKQREADADAVTKQDETNW